jgi:hypothetical protein
MSRFSNRGTRPPFPQPRLGSTARSTEYPKSGEAPRANGLRPLPDDGRNSEEKDCLEACGAMTIRQEVRHALDGATCRAFNPTNPVNGKCEASACISGS